MVHAAGAVISSPFHVISIRMMAQFVGRETKYSSIFGSIVQIYKDEGILGELPFFIEKSLLLNFGFRILLGYHSTSSV